MKRLLAGTVAAAALVAAALWWLTAPSGGLDGPLPPHDADLANGADLFHAGACASCHATPGREDQEPPLLGGGRELVTGYGLFRAPNISGDPENGIGGWSDLQFVNAMRFGLSPEGRHYYPSFPYASYTRIRTEDLLDLKAYLDTLPAVSNRVADHELPFPWNFRRGVGLWKRLYLDSSFVVELSGADASTLRGQYLVEGVGHCGECHTSRDFAGGLRYDRWLAGAPNPDDEGQAPNITPHPDGLAKWSRRDLAYYFESGLTPDYDTSGGSMVAVQENLARLSAEDRAAIADYLKSIPALSDALDAGE